MNNVRYITNSSSLRFYAALIASTSIFFFHFLTPTYAASGHLYVITTVVNDSGGNWKPSDFSISVKRNGNNIPGSPAPGVGNQGTLYTVEEGQYSISSGPYEKYSTTYGGDCDINGRITVTPNADKACIVTGNDRPTTLHLITTVTNDNGGKASAGDFKTHVKIGGADLAGSPLAGAETPGTTFDLSVGTYTISQDANNSYTTSFSGDCDSNGNITFSLGDTKSCTISNDDTQTSGIIPGFPNTGAIFANRQVCLSTSNLSWIITGLAVIGIIFYLRKSNQDRLKPKK